MGCNERTHVRGIKMISKKFFILLTQLASTRWISKIAGAFANHRLSKKFIPWFIKTYQINLDEIEKPWTSYTTLNEFFTRRLVPSARNIISDPNILVSPVDGLITSLGPIKPNGTFEIKNQVYQLEDFFNSDSEAAVYQNGFFWVIYLSPSNYHRIHSPVTGTAVKSAHILGRAYPVNEFGIQNIPNALSKNERLITFFEHATQKVALIKVGALNVSSIVYTHHPLPSKISNGEELAYFQFGSTVVLLTQSSNINFDESIKINASIKMGQPLAQLN